MATLFSRSAKSKASPFSNTGRITEPSTGRVSINISGLANTIQAEISFFFSPATGAGDELFALFVAISIILTVFIRI